ncbi:MAG TPA: sensor histidine kinase [Streptosporangiales bacterium]
MSGTAVAWPYATDSRRSVLVTVVPYVLLGALTVVTVAAKWSAGASLYVDLGLCLFTAAWMLWMFTLHPAWRDRAPLMILFLGVLLVLMAVLILRDPWFGIFTPAGYFYAFRLLPWPWLLVGVVAVAVLAGTAQASDVDKTTAWGVVTYLAVLVVNVLGMSGLAVFIWRNTRRNDERDRALAEASEANRRLESMLAENAGLHERLLTQAREAGVLDERQRMAREIHDTLAQGLAGIITQLQAAEQAGADEATRHRHVGAATRLARESLSEARRSVHALRPQQLETGRLADALAGVAERWSALHGLAVEVTTTGTPRPMRPEAEVALLRTAQEALTNVTKHARAGRVGVTLSYLDDDVALDVRDDGVGFDPAHLDGARADAATGGFGLVAMRQRIEALAGTLQVESEPGGGTAISARVPVGDNG